MGSSLARILAAFQATARWPTEGIPKHLSLCVRSRDIDGLKAQCCDWVAWEPGLPVAAKLGRIVPVQTRAKGGRVTYHAGYKHPGDKKCNVLNLSRHFDDGELRVLHHTGVEHTRFGADLPDDLASVYQAWMRAFCADFAPTRPCAECQAPASPACSLCGKARCCPPEEMVEEFVVNEGNFDPMAELERQLAHLKDAASVF